MPFFTLTFDQIERVGSIGISLKQISILFALDFYKSRRMSINIQAHPEIVTIMKETNNGKSKFQAVVLRKFLAQNKVSYSHLYRILCEHSFFKG